MKTILFGDKIKNTNPVLPSSLLRAGDNNCCRFSLSIVQISGLSVEFRRYKPYHQGSHFRSKYIIMSVYWLQVKLSLLKLETACNESAERREGLWRGEVCYSPDGAAGQIYSLSPLDLGAPLSGDVKG